jgi:hypothetical protein
MHGASKKDKEEIGKRIGVFLQQFKPRAQKGQEPNDRRYDRAIEQYLRKLNPEDLDVLLNGEVDERLNLSNESSTDGSEPPQMNSLRELDTSIQMTEYR